MTTKITKDNLNEVIEQLEETLGEQGVDWDGAVYRVPRSDEIRVYVVTPIPANRWRVLVEKASKVESMKPGEMYSIMNDVVRGCLVQDPSGNTLESFAADAEVRPALLTDLFNKARALSEAGVEDLKKA